MNTPEEKYIVELIKPYGRFTPAGVSFFYGGMSKIDLAIGEKDQPTYTIVPHEEEGSILTEVLRKGLAGGAIAYDTVKEAYTAAQDIVQAISDLEDVDLKYNNISEEFSTFLRAVYKGIHYE